MNKELLQGADKMKTTEMTNGLKTGGSSVNAAGRWMVRGTTALAAMISLGIATPANAANLLSNTATANGSPAAGTLTPPTSTVDVDVVNKNNSMTLSKTVLGVTTNLGANASAIDALDVITYQYVITNTGNQTLTGVVPTDTGPTFDGTAGTNTLDTSSWTPVSLAPGASQTFTATYELSQADVDNAVGITDAVSNTASATGTDPQTVTVNPVCGASCTATTTIPNVSSMTVAKTVSSITVDQGGNPTQTDQGDIITYQYVVTNTGNTTLTGVAPTDAGPMFGTHSATNLLSAFSPATAVIAPGASQTFTATYVLTQTDVDRVAGITDGVSNTASATGTDPQTNTVTPASSSTATATIAATPAMSITKAGTITTDNGTTGEADVGDVITYTYTVTNTGNVTINAVTVNDVHDGYGTDPVPGNETGTSVTFGSTDLGAPNGTWDSLRPGDTITFTATYTVVQADIDNLQ